jgi:hypothetical protein
VASPGRIFTAAGSVAHTPIAGHDNVRPLTADPALASAGIRDMLILLRRYGRSGEI